LIEIDEVRNMTALRAVIAAVWMIVLACAGAGAIAQGATTPKLALKGYDLVEYFTGNKAQLGSTDFYTDFDGMRYQFSSARNKAAFSAEPDRYLPEFGGYCAMGISRGKKFESDPTLWKVIDGKLYVFSSPAASEAAGKDPEILTRARQQWQAMK
jgi:YHS domain-containing protein